MIIYKTFDWTSLTSAIIKVIIEIEGILFNVSPHNKAMKKQALLIGINNYSDKGSLHNILFARQDAEAVSAALQSYYGFSEDEITLMTCQQTGMLSPATPELILNQLRPDMFPEPLDLFIFGFWGHGIWDSNVRYLCPMTTLENNLSESCLPLEEVTRRIAELPIHNACFILDCCQNLSGRGAAAYMPEKEIETCQNLGRNIVLNKKYANPKSDPVFERKAAILNSCRPGEIAYEWDEKKHGIFTAHLLEAMEQRLNTVNQWATYLENKVSKTAAKLGKKSQTPFYTLEGCIELPVSQVQPQVKEILPTIFTTSRVDLDEKMKQATLKLVELFQDSARIHENKKVKEWFMRQKEDVLVIYLEIDNHSITGQTVYTRLFEIASNAGNWIKANRSLFGGKKLVYISYLWYSWVEFAKKNSLEDITKALNP